MNIKFNKKFFLENDGQNCPYCSASTESMWSRQAPDYEQNMCYMFIQCEDCGQKWKETYELIDVVEDN